MATSGNRPVCRETNETPGISWQQNKSNTQSKKNQNRLRMPFPARVDRVCLDSNPISAESGSDQIMVKLNTGWTKRLIYQMIHTCIIGQ